MVRVFILAASALGLATSPALADDALPGPIPAEVVRVVDGDTIRVRARIWVDQEVNVAVRLAGIDAPEIYRPKCDAEKVKARAAKDAVAGQVGTQVFLREVRNGKYAGRVVADAVLSDGESLSERLIAQGHAIPDGAEKPWCDAPEPSPTPEVMPSPCAKLVSRLPWS